MSLLALSLAYLRRRPWGTLLNVTLLALGVASIVVLLLLSSQLEQRLTRDAGGVDLVVGATGSPLQLVLSAVYHVDSPTGNIPAEQADALAADPLIALAVPLALGDSYQSFRIVGTTTDYLGLYDARVERGQPWRALREVVLGADAAAALGLDVDSTFVSTHGLGEGGEGHAATPLRVVGVLAPTGSVVDRLILTSVATVEELHAAEVEDDEPDVPEADPLAPPPDGDVDDPTLGDDDFAPMPDAAPGPAGAASGASEGPTPVLGLPAAPPTSEYTALLVRFASPLGAVQLPRRINAEGGLQAAVPAAETQRLLGLLGVGLDALRLFGLVLILAAGLGVAVALTNALQERRYDLAVMRSLGASRGTLLAHVLLEGVLLAAAGALLGLVLGHLATGALGAALAGSRTAVPVSGWAFTPGELALVGGILLLGALAALVPAVQAYRADIARTLARG